MEEIPLSALSITLIVLLAASGFFSLSETAMMASNRFRLRHMAQSGHRGAQKALALLSRTDKMLGVILLGNNLVNSRRQIGSFSWLSAHPATATLLSRSLVYQPFRQRPAAANATLTAPGKRRGQTLSRRVAQPCS